jgi:quinol monooxygenase YgiN
MVRLTVSMEAESSRSAQDLLEALRFVVMSTRLEPSCLASCAWCDPDGTVRYLEEWADEAHLRARVRSPDFTPLLSIIESASNPRVRFDFVAVARGLDFIAEVRGG